MDSDGIGLLIFGGTVASLITAMLLFVRSRGLKRRVALRAMAQPLDFEPISAPPPSFPLEKLPVVRWGEKGGRTFSQAFRGQRLGREVLFFDYFLVQEQGYKILVTTVAETIVAARGGPECFPTEKNDPTLQLESVEGWTIVYKIRTSAASAIFSAEEIQALILAMPAPGLQ